MSADYSRWPLPLAAIVTCVGVALLALGLWKNERRLTNCILAVGTAVLATVLVQMLVQWFMK